MSNNLETYGTVTTPKSVRTFMKHVINTNLKNAQLGKKLKPVCIWGKHGIGKTALVKQVALELGYDFHEIPFAQFEEVGDILGMPDTVDGKTVILKPEWVPEDNGRPVIMLADDINRADDRILRALMQVVQDGKTVSWELPKNCTIIATANPDGGDYSVTPMDEAMLTRFKHVTMEFDAKEWAAWAIENNIDERGINFVLTYPEMVTGNRTTPRSLESFFDSIRNIEDLSANIGLVQMLAESDLDANTVASWMSFVNNKLSKLISPEDMINSKNYKKEVEAHLNSIVKNGNSPRVDIIATVATRLVQHLIVVMKDELNDLQIKNIENFLMWDMLPNDIRLSIATDLTASNKESLRMLIAIPQIGKLLLERM